jgi:transcription initiation factor TFIIIB Brf1 subunit/transcription initiation factor TFIIB
MAKKTKKVNNKTHLKRNVEKEYYEEIEFVCKKTGEVIKQKVKVTKFRTKIIDQVPTIGPAVNIDAIDSSDEDETVDNED